MSDRITRRKLITTGLASVAGVAGLAAAEKIADRYGLIPPDAHGKYAVGTTLTYAAQRILTAHHSLAREFSRGEISKIAPVNGDLPKTDIYDQLRFTSFKDWRLPIDGLVARPTSFSLDEIKRLPMKSQATHLACEEGWSFIAEWHGVPLSELLNAVGISDRARYVAFFAYDGMWDSLDLADAFHPQTLMCYGMNGADLPLRHGAPIRLRVPRQLGYKSVKYLSHLTVTDSLKYIKNGKGSVHVAGGYSWYVGI
jgi:DMSO/TMAO reductase YedYZ molybdopterin-dependent catalytic subunit